MNGVVTVDTMCYNLVPEENNDEPQNFDLREGQGGNADCLLFSRVVVDVIYFLF